jgi:hypothetical protein
MKCPVLVYKPAAEAVGKWESRAVCGISKRGGKVCFLTFPRSGFSTAANAAEVFTMGSPWLV